MAASEYFFEYAMVGTLDMAYPSNEATFHHLIDQNFDVPSILIKYPHSGQSLKKKFLKFIFYVPFLILSILMIF